MPKSTKIQYAAFLGRQRMKFLYIDSPLRKSGAQHKLRTFAVFSPSLLSEKVPSFAKTIKTRRLEQNTPLFFSIEITPLQYQPKTWWAPFWIGHDISFTTMSILSVAASPLLPTLPSSFHSPNPV